MKRDFLRTLEVGDGVRLPDAVIDAIMAEHGKDVQSMQANITALTGERDGLKTQLTEATTNLEKAKGWETKAGEVQKQLDALQADVNVRNIRDKVSAAKGIPASLLTETTEDGCTAQADAILKWHGDVPKYPSVPDGGEHNPAGASATRDQFANWFQTS